MEFDNISSEVWDLVNEACNGTISPSQQKLLDDHIVRDIRVAGLYSRMFELHTELYFHMRALREQESTKTPNGASQVPSNPSAALPWFDLSRFPVSRPNLFSCLVAALVICSIVLVMGVIVPPSIAPIVQTDRQAGLSQSSVMARLTKHQHNIRINGQEVTHFWVPLGSEQRLEIDWGFAEVALHDGAIVTLEGPTHIVIETRNGVRLIHGKVFAVVPPKAIGFTVRTPNAQLIDRGTEFGVQVDLQGNTRAQVDKGAVDVVIKDTSRQEHTTQAIRLNAGDGLTFGVSGKVQKEGPGQQLFHRRFPDIPSYSVLTFEMESPAAKNWSEMLQDYGDKITGRRMQKGSNLFRYQGNKHFTPNVSVAYSTSPGAKYCYWNSGDWQGGVGFLKWPDQNPRKESVFFETLFTPEPGYGVQVQSFVLDDWDGDGQGHTVNWFLYADSVDPEKLIAKGRSVVLDSDQEQLILTGMQSFHRGPVILRIEHVSGRNAYLAIDNIHFGQAKM